MACCIPHGAGLLQNKPPHVGASKTPNAHAGFYPSACPPWYALQAHTKLITDSRAPLPLSIIENDWHMRLRPAFWQQGADFAMSYEDLSLDLKFIDRSQLAASIIEDSIDAGTDISQGKHLKNPAPVRGQLILENVSHAIPPEPVNFG
jgi:hypothetical protein